MTCMQCGNPISLDTGYCEYDAGPICLACDSTEPAPTPAGWDSIPAGPETAAAAPPRSAARGNESSREWWDRLPNPDRIAALATVDPSTLTPRQRKAWSEMLQEPCRYGSHIAAQTAVDAAFRVARDGRA